jgi:hypothetical protein
MLDLNSCFSFGGLRHSASTMNVEAGQQPAAVQHGIEFAGGEEHAPPEEIGEAAQPRTSQFLNSVAAPQSGPEPLTALESNGMIYFTEF